MTGPSSRGSAPGGLQPRDLVREAFGALWQGRNELLRVAAVPVGITLILDAVLLFGRARGELEQAGQPEPWFFVLLLLSIPPSILLAVNWLRVLVLGPASVSGLGLRWGRREMRFLARLLLIGLAGLAATIVLTLPIGVFFALLGQMSAAFQQLANWMPLASALLALFVYAYITMGFSLALVAAAIDGPGGMAGSWRATRGQRGRLVLAVLATVGPFYLLMFLLPLLFGILGVTRVAPLSSLLVQALLATITSGAGMALISVVYRRLAGASVVQASGDASR